MNACANDDHIMVFFQFGHFFQFRDPQIKDSLSIIIWPRLDNILLEPFQPVNGESEPLAGTTLGPSKPEAMSSRGIKVQFGLNTVTR